MGVSHFSRQIDMSGCKLYCKLWTETGTHIGRAVAPFEVWWSYSNRINDSSPIHTDTNCRCGSFTLSPALRLKAAGLCRCVAWNEFIWQEDPQLSLHIFCISQLLAFCEPARISFLKHFSHLTHSILEHISGVLLRQWHHPVQRYFGGTLGGRINEKMQFLLQRKPFPDERI